MFVQEVPIGGVNFRGNHFLISFPVALCGTFTDIVLNIRQLVDVN